MSNTQADRLAQWGMTLFIHLPLLLPVLIIIWWALFMYRVVIKPERERKAAQSVEAEADSPKEGIWPPPPNRPVA